MLNEQKGNSCTARYTIVSVMEINKESNMVRSNEMTLSLFELFAYKITASLKLLTITG